MTMPRQCRQFKIKATADTGCSVTIVREDIAKFNKLKHSRSNLPRLLTATGQKINVLGRANIRVTTDKQTEYIDILISSDLDKDMLWGIRDLKKFRQIPEGFPNMMIQKTKKI